MYDDSGEEAFTRVDYERRLLILSHRCRGRHAVLAVLTMMLSAWQREADTRPMDYDQLHSVASVMERFLVDMGLEDAATQRLSSPRPTPKTDNRWRNTRRAALVAALLGSTGAAWWAAGIWRSQPAPPAPEQVVAISGPLVDLAPGKRLTAVPFEAPLGTTAAHPFDPAFVVSTAQNEILRHNLDGTTQLLATTQAPAIWLSVSPNGKHVAACDIARNLYLVSWDGQHSTKQWPAEGGTPLMVSVANDGTITWLGDQSNTFVTNAQTGSTTRLLDVEQAVAASSGRDVTCQRQRNTDHHELEIQVRGQPLALRTRLMPNQIIHSLDASADLRTIAVVLSDGLLLVFDERLDGRYEMQELPLPAPTGSARVRVAQSGGTALVLADQLYRVDLRRVRVTATLDLPDAGGPTCDLAWNEATGQILIARTKEGSAWQ